KVQPSGAEKARVALLDYLREQKLLYEMAGRNLEKGKDWTPNDNEEFKKQEDAMDAAGRRWDDLVKKGN
ncbi:MAG TPA: hypothetical protein VKD72_22365, partial [Gemmataceae bacterium]|nr:hypothetical protein [Gemmataceae bacterium]